MDFNEQLRTFREKEKVQTAVMLAMRQRLDGLKLDGTEATTAAAIAETRAWLQALEAPHLEPGAREAILTAAETAIRERARAAAQH